MRRVVVTGMGAITPIGLNVEEFWKGIHAGQIGFGPITKFDASEYKAHLAAEVKGFVGKEIKSQADLDEFKKMYGIDGEIEKEY